MKKLFTLFIILIPINVLKIFFLKLVGHKVSYKSKIGFSIIITKNLFLSQYSSIGHFNFIKVNSLILKESSSIKSLNYIKGPFKVCLGKSSGISNSNKIRRAYSPITYGSSELNIGENSFIVSNHFLDLTRSVKIGKNSILAGINSQIWTHGYYHADEGPERIRIDGEVRLGDNVYVGSSCIFNPGLKVGNAINIGAGSVISKDLNNPGMYVGNGLRFLDNNIEKIKCKLKRVEDGSLIETVFNKD